LTFEESYIFASDHLDIWII